MKLKQIDIKNIASIGEATLHFDSGLLSEANRFLICGDMGTGKSTLLDSICLALYGNTPRLKQAPNDKRNFGNDEITARDPRNLLRHGTNNGSVRLEFTGSDGVNYTAHWSVRRTRNNTLDTAKHTLSYGNEVITNKKDLSDIIVNHAVGLDFDQFCRTTMLAQGQFTQFLKSSEDEKSAILEKLTKTDIFSAVGKEIALIRSEKEKAHKTLADQISGANLLTDEEINALNVKIQNLKDELARTNDEKKITDAKLQWLKQLADAQSQFQKAENEFKTWKEKVSQPEYQEETRLIEDWNTSGEGRELIRNLAKLERTLHELKTTLIEKGAEQFELAVKGLNDFAQKLTGKREKLEKIEGDIRTEKQHENMYANAQAIIAKLETVFKHRNNALEQERGKQRLENALPQLQNTASTQKKANDSDLQNIKNQKDKKEEAQKSLNNMHPEKLVEQRGAIEHRKDVLNKTQNAILELARAIDNYNAARKIVQDTKDEIANETKKITENQPIEEEKKHSLAKAKAALEKTKLTLGDEADKLRAQLQVGDTCPVCGQKISEILNTENLSKLLKPQEELVNKNEEELRKVSTSIQSSQNLLKKYEKRLPELENDCQKSADNQAEKLNTALQWCAQAGIPAVEATNDSIQTTSKLLEAANNELKNQSKALEQYQREVDNQRTAINKIDKTLQKAIESEKDSSLKLEKAKNAVTNCEKDIKKAIEDAKNENATAANVMSEINGVMSWPDWENSWKENPNNFTKTLSDNAKSYKEWGQQATQLGHEIEKDERILQNVSDKRREIATQWPQWEQNATACLTVADLENTWNRLANNATKLHTQTDETENQVKDTKARLNDFLTSHPALSAERLNELCDMSEEKIPVALHKKTEDAFSAADGALKQAQDVLGNAQKAEHPNMEESENVVTLSQKSKIQEAQISNLTTLIGEAQGRLEQNKENTQKVAEKKLKLEEAQKLLNLWKTLSDLFGTNNGTAFRNIAQSYLLRNLVASANQYLQELTKRYTLDCIPGTLTLCLRDQYQGNVESPVDTLSGGESFLVSLSLALALSSINRQGFHIDTLFIDEGFGNLSSNELDIVMNLLGRLQKMNGKRVGIISHVESVKDHIPVHVEVRRIDPTCSKIEVKNTAIGK